MTTPWRKVIRDFWQERARTALVVVAIALGISAFSTVLSSYAILTRELDEGYLETNPASATLRIDAINDELLTAVTSHPAVGAAEARRTLTGRLKVGPVEWRNLVLFVVKDFGNIRVSTLKPQQGAWPPATGEILIERDAVQVARARIGDTVTIRIAGGKDQTLRLSGTVKDVGQAQARMENSVYGYITLDTLMTLGEKPSLDQLKIQVAENRFDEHHIRSVTDDIKKLIEARGQTVRRVDIPEPGKHPHSRIMGLLLLAMSSFGLFVLFLSGILVVNFLTALMAAQVRQIGVMKAVGGSRWQIARIYFGQALLVGISAVILALPAGIWGGRVLCRYLAVLLNFDINSFAVPAWVYLLLAIVGMIVPLLAASYPIWKGTRVSVREALADYGVGRNAFGVSAFDRAMASIGGTARPLLLAIRNSFRRRARLALTLVTLAAGGLFFMSALNIRTSLIHTLDRLFATMKFDLSVSLGTMQSLEKVERAVRNTPGISRVEGWIATEGMISAATSPDRTSTNVPSSSSASGGHGGGGQGGGHGSGGGHGGGGAGDRFSILALPTDSQMFNPDIVDGRSLQPGDGEGVMVVNTALATAKGERIKVGDLVTLRMGPSQMAWRVIGIANEPFSPSIAYIPLTYFEQKGHSGVTNSLRLALDKTDLGSINSVRAALDRNLEREEVRAQSSSTKADGRYGFDQHMLMIYVFLIIVSCVIGGVGSLGLTSTLSLSALERRREMGVLRAIGASSSMIWLIVATEGVVIGVLSWALAALFAWPLGRTLGNFMVGLMFKSDLNFSFEPAGLLIWLAISILVGAVASFLPAWRAARRTVREAIGYE